MEVADGRGESLMGSDLSFPMNLSLAHQESASIERRKLGVLKDALRAIADIHDGDDGPYTYCRECGSATPCESGVVANEALEGIKKC